MSQSIQELKYLLLQVRRHDDPMKAHELECFSRELGCDRANVFAHDLISSPPHEEQLHAVDAALIGGSGDYSVAKGGPWFAKAMETFVWLHDHSKPTFASCWGFQAFAQGLGGKVVTDLNRAEIGTIEIRLTEAAKTDPVFGTLQPTFKAQMGHQDIVDRLPSDAVLMASTDRVENEAFAFEGKPIYGTQFHPELRVEDLIRRLEAYPTYVETISGLPLDEFVKSCHPTPDTSKLLPRFAEVVLANRIKC